MTPSALAELLRSTTLRVLDEHGLAGVEVPARVRLSWSDQPGGVDCASPLAMEVAPAAGVDCADLAGWTAEALAGSGRFDRVSVDRAFVGVALTAEGRADIIRAVLADPGYGAAAPVPAPERDWEPVQYAHARLSSTLRHARDLALVVPCPETPDPALELLTHPREILLVRAVAAFPDATASGRPRPLVAYLDRLTEAYHQFDDTCRVLPQGDEPPGRRTTARLALCVAVRRVLATGLGLFGVTAPERM